MRIVMPWIDFIVFRLDAASSLKLTAQRRLIALAQHIECNHDTTNHKYRTCCWSYAVYFMGCKSSTLG